MARGLLPSKAPMVLPLRLSTAKFFVIALVAAAMPPTTALAHERFVKHDVLRPFPHDFFFHVDHNVMSIAVRVFVVMAVVLFLWFRRHAIEAFVETKLLARAKDRRHRLINFGLRFVTDEPVAHPWFHRFGDRTAL